MRKLITLLLILFYFSACESIEMYRQGYGAKPTTQLATNTESERPEYEVVVIKHPDLNFPLSDPAAVVIYEGFKPLNDKYIVVGKMGIIEDTIENYYSKTQEIKKKAAEIGGQAIIIVDAGTKTEEYGGNIVSGISIPRYLWWDFYPYYMGTDYYWYKSPKTTVSTSYRLGLIIRWIEDLNKEQKAKLLSFLVDEAERKMKNEIAELQEIYPFAKEKEVWILLSEKDKNGNFKYSVKQAMRISHERNRKKIEMQ